MSSIFSEERKYFHASLLGGVVRLKEDDTPNFADASSKTSSKIAKGIYERLKGAQGTGEVGAQQAGKKFEQNVLEIVESCFKHLVHLRPGSWRFKRNEKISNFEQYSHLTALRLAAVRDIELGAVLGSDYVIKPDIVVFRTPESDENINAIESLVDSDIAKLTPLRQINQKQPLLHASISCKWTIRSDRSQNSRTEALNLIRNRKGRLPHIVVVTAEPLPSRIASIALGTGDVDCTYHIALYELIEAVRDSGQEEAINIMNMMIEGKRLRDISDLPLDIAT